jgi:hypothetical protein
MHWASLNWVHRLAPLAVVQTTAVVAEIAEIAEIAAIALRLRLALASRCISILLVSLT